MFPSFDCSTAAAVRMPRLLAVVVIVAIVVVVLTLTDSYNSVRGHRTGSNDSGAGDYLRRKNK